MCLCQCVFTCVHMHMEARTTLDMFSLYPKLSPAISITAEIAGEARDAIQH